MVLVSLDSQWKTWKWNDTHGDTAACWAAMSLCQCQQRTREKGKKQSICSPLSLPSFLSLSGFYLANGGLHADWCWVSLKPKPHCANVCVCERVCVRVRLLFLILQSSVIIPQQGLTMPFGHLSFHVLRSLSSLSPAHTNNNRGVTSSALAWKSSVATYRAASRLIEAAHQTALQSLSLFH